MFGEIEALIPILDSNLQTTDHTLNMSCTAIAADLTGQVNYMIP